MCVCIHTYIYIYIYVLKYIREPTQSVKFTWMCVFRADQSMCTTSVLSSHEGWRWKREGGKDVGVIAKDVHVAKGCAF